MAEADILGTNSNDKIVLGDDDYNISALSGNNTIIVGSGNNHISAENGSNSLSLGEGNNEVTLGNGRNRVVAADGETILTTGSGHDTLTLGDGDNSVTAGDGNNRITSGDGNNTIEAGNGADRILVGGGSNVIRAGDGRNSITATGNTDIVTGVHDDKIALGDGQHVIAAGEGKNSISTGDATVAISTGDGADRITVGTGGGTIQAGAGKNQIKAGDGTFAIETGDGHDVITLGHGNSTVTAGGGNNRITLGDGDTHIAAGNGADRIIVGSGSHVIRAGDGKNSIVATGTADIVTGDHDDKIALGDGQYVIAAGEGKNSISTGDATVAISTGDGADRITVGTGGGTIQAGAGKNQIKAGDGTFAIETGDGHDVITLGHGNSTVTAGGGNNRITLGDGDTHIAAGNGADRIIVGSGSHVIRAGDGNNSIVATGTADIVTGDHDDKIALGDGQYVIAAGEGKNSISTGDATVEISTGGGADRITVGTGGGTIQAGAGKNQIKAGDGAFQITTGNGSDRISVGQGEGQIHAGSGANSLSVAGGDFEVETGNGNDRITLADGSYVVASTGGNNQIKIGDAVVTVTTGDGNDSILVGTGSATIDAGAGQNRITAAGDVNTITTGDGIDTITVGAGSNTISAGSGSNRITAGDGDLELTTLGGNDNVRMGDGLSEISVGGGNNRVSVGAGQHQISAGDGNNTIATGDATSRVTLGDGDNRVSMGDGDGFVSAGDGNNRIALGEGPAFVEVGDGKNSITLSQGDITIQTGDGNNTITQAAGGGGFASAITTGAGADRITLGDGNGDIDSGAGVDSIRTGGGDNQIDAGAGNDQVSTGAGSDWISGGAGNDKLNGGAGTDWAVFRGSFSDYYIEALNASTIQVSSTTGDVIDIGTDQLRNFEYIYFEGDGYTLDIRDSSILDTLYTVDLQDDAVSSTSEGPVEISLSSLLDNDASQGVGTASYQVAATSAAGLALMFDGVSITYNADDALQHLAAGEVFSDSFSYTVTDANGNTATATVNLSVTGQGSGPIAHDDRLGSAGETSQPGYIAGDEFNIETGDARWNNLPSTAATGTGGAIVVWDARGPASNEDQGIRCTILDGEGNVVVSEFQVNTPGVLGMSAVVSSFPNGDFVVAWETWQEDDAELGTKGYVVMARLYNADGTPKGDEFAATDPFDIEGRLHPEIVTLENRSFAVSWTNSEYYENDLLVSIFDQSGNRIAEPFSLDEDTDGSLLEPEISALPDGGFVATWTAGGTVRARIFDEAGAEVVPEFQINSETLTGSDAYSSVSVHDDGRFVVTWKHRDGTGNDGDSFIRAAVFNSDGSVAIDEFDVAAADGPVHFGLVNQVEFLPNGQFVVAWTNYPGEGIYYHDVFARIYNADGTPATEVFLVNEQTAEHQHAVDIVVLDNESFMITWESMDGTRSSDSDIAGRIYDFEGHPFGDNNTDEDHSLEINVAQLLENDEFTNTQNLVFSLNGDQSANGASLSYDADTGLVTYDPTAADDIQALAQGDSLEDTFTYTLTDAAGNTDTATVTLTVGGADEAANTAPNAQDDRLTGTRAGIATIEGSGEITISSNLFRASQVIARQDGGSIFAWEEYDDHLTGIRVRIVDADGNDVRTPFYANSDEYGQQNEFELTELEDGGFAVTWQTRGRNRPDLETHTTLRVFNADGSPRTDEIALVNWEGDDFSISRIIGLSNGNILVTSIGSTYSTGGYETHSGFGGTIYTPQGVQVGRPITMGRDDLPTGGYLQDVTVEALENGGFITFWTTRSTEGGQKTTIVQAGIFDNSGREVVTNLEIASRTIDGNWVDLMNVQVSANEDGSFVVTWHETSLGLGTEMSLAGRVFNSDGTAASEEFTFFEHVVTGTTGFVANGDVTWLSSDQFVVTWTGLDSSSFGIFAQVFTADGTPVTDSIVVNDGEEGSQSSSSVALLNDGRFVVSWHTDENGTRDIKAQVFELSGEAVDLPFAMEDSIATVQTSDLLANDTDVDGDAFVFSLDGAVSENGASLAYDADTGLITYDPTAADAIQALEANEVLEDTFSYTISDGNGGFDQATVTVVVGGLDEILS